ncbi:MAG: prephenate dehydratase [Planctomycetaceae bacterium]
MAKKTAGKSRTKAASKRAPAKKPVVKKKETPATKAPVKKKAANAAPTKARVPKAASLASEIKKLDAELLKLVNKRASLAVKYYENNPGSSSSVFSADIDQALLGKLDAAEKGPLSAVQLRSIFRPILSAARQKVRNTRVAYLGPPFSYTHIAAIDRFGESADLVPVNTIATVFEAVNRGHAEYGMVPIENSTDGRVVDTLDMFTRLPLRICGEVQLAIHHNLLGRCARGDITEIYSKPQAFSQCRDWLAKNMPQARLIEVTSTSTAAQLARDKPGVGAVASQQAALQYDLDIIAEGIEDNRNNVTRFAVIGEQAAEQTGHDRTALLLQIPHKSGSLADCLMAFRNNKLNLTWIESFPLREPEKGYLFFLDFEGHMSDRAVRKMLSDVEKRAVKLQILGSYPRSTPI